MADDGYAWSPGDRRFAPTGAAGFRRPTLTPREALEGLRPGRYLERGPEPSASPPQPVAWPEWAWP